MIIRCFHDFFLLSHPLFWLLIVWSALDNLPWAADLFHGGIKIIQNCYIKDQKLPQCPECTEAKKKVPISCDAVFLVGIWLLLGIGLGSG